VNQDLDWEMMDEAQALQASAVVAFDEQGFDAATRPKLDELLRAWASAYKDLHPEPLAMPALEAGMDVARMELQHEVLACRQPCLAVPLLPDRWLILARTDVLREVGSENIARSAHENAINHARRNGRPYNVDALRVYGQQRSQESL